MRPAPPASRACISGVDATNNTLFTDGLTLGTECAGCEFTRTISVVPEPQTYTLMLAGLAAFSLSARRLSRRRTP